MSVLFWGEDGYWDEDAIDGRGENQFETSWYWGYDDEEKEYDPIYDPERDEDYDEGEDELYAPLAPAPDTPEETERKRDELRQLIKENTVVRNEILKGWKSK
jgi:hypothetical protein